MNSACWGEEFVIQPSEGSRVWANVLSAPRYLLRLSGQGKGDSYLLDNELALPLTKPISDLEQPDQWPARKIFIRDNDTDEFWPLTDLPDPKCANFQIRHGAGHTIFSQTHQGINTQTTILIDKNESIELWQVTLKNSERIKRRFSLFYALEWGMAVADRPQTVWEDNILFAFQGDRMGASALGYFTLNRQIDSFDGDRSAFVGVLGRTDQPFAVKEGKCSRSQAYGNAAAGVLQKNLTIGPLAEASLTALMGGQVLPAGASAQKLSQAKQTIKRTVQQYCSDRYLESVGGQTDTAWRVMHEKVLVNTPEHQFNHSFNQWLKLQSHINLSLPSAKTPLTPEGGYLPALKGIISCLPNDPYSSLERLISLVAKQKRDGNLIGTEEEPEANYWLAEAIIRALEETGDQKLANQEIPYADFGRGTLLEHLSRSLRQRLKSLGENDLVERSDKSVFLIDNAQLAINLQQAVPVFTRFNETSAANYFQDKYDRIKEASERYFWEGHWFAYAKLAGKKFGTPKNRELKVFLPAQAWAVLAGFGQKSTQEKALRSALKRLITQHGPCYSLPPTSNKQLFRENEGEGYNGGIVIDSLAPFVAALAKLGWGDEMFQLWQQTNGLERYLKSPRLVAEPFAYPRYIWGPDSPNFGKDSGLANLSQCSGVLWSALLESMLGVRATMGGLKISPCLPRDWRQVELTRQFRKAQYHFRIINNFRLCRGIDRIIVDGLRLTGDVIKPYSAGNHYIEVYLG